MRNLKHKYDIMLLFFVGLLFMGCVASLENGPEANNSTLTATLTTTSTFVQTSLPTFMPVQKGTQGGLDLSSLEGKIVFDASFNVYVINADGTGLKNLTPNLVSGYAPVWSPDGKLIAFTGSTGGLPQIFVMNADGSDQRQLTQDTTPTGAGYPTWSPDGKKIIYISNPDTSASEYYIINNDGSQQQQITNNSDWKGQPSWSPNGDVIAISAILRKNINSRYSPESIYLMNISGTILRQLTGLNNSQFTMDKTPRWSPDSNQIAFNSLQGSCLGISVMNADGTNKDCILRITPRSETTPLINHIDPSWSPRGDYIVFSSTLSGNYNLYVMKPDGSNITQLTDLPGFNDSPDWTLAP